MKDYKPQIVEYVNEFLLLWSLNLALAVKDQSMQMNKNEISKNINEAENCLRKKEKSLRSIQFIELF